MCHHDTKLKVHTVSAENLSEGDTIVWALSDRPGGFDRVCEVRFIRDHKVHVGLNHWTASVTIPEGEKLYVLDQPTLSFN